MDSKLAREGKQAVLSGSRLLTPEGRLEAFLVHSRLMMELYRAGKERRTQASNGRR